MLKPHLRLVGRLKCRKSTNHTHSTLLLKPDAFLLFGDFYGLDVGRGDAEGTPDAVSTEGNNDACAYYIGYQVEDSLIIRFFESVY